MQPGISQRLAKAGANEMKYGNGLSAVTFNNRRFSFSYSVMYVAFESLQLASLAKAAKMAGWLAGVCG